VVVRTLFRRSAGFGELVAQGLDLRVQFVALLLGFQQRLVLLRELLFPDFELLTGDELPGGGGPGHQIVAPRRGVSSGGGGVGARQPVTAVVELLHHLQGVGGARGLGVVHRLVSHLLDEPGLLKDHLGQAVLKHGVVQQGPQALVVGHPEEGVVAVEPVHHGLQGKPGVEARRPGIPRHGTFGLGGGFGNGGEVLGEEGEVAHDRRPRWGGGVIPKCSELAIGAQGSLVPRGFFPGFPAWGPGGGETVVFPMAVTAPRRKPGTGATRRGHPAPPHGPASESFAAPRPRRWRQSGAAGRGGAL